MGPQRNREEFAVEYLGFFILPFLGGLILFLVIGAAVKSPGRALQKRFVSMGDMRGKAFTEISAVVGVPQSISAMPDGGKVAQWLSTGYHIALVFDEKDICQGISHQSAV
jgi:hypothetical protein